MLPSTTINEIEKLLKELLWCQGPLTTGKAKVAWKQVCLSKEQGGLGIKSLKKWNEILLIKQLWKIIERKESLWNVSVWFDKWDLKGPLCEIIPRRAWYGERLPELCNITIPTLSNGINDKACSFMLCDLDFEPLSLSLSSMPSCDLVSLTNILILCLILKASNQS
ncbi:hypothetical protein Tco_0856842 [Tanacetum coccineum]|uniref:Uncharacterized protein n=1 Tax=Tanacetum coccineum TaxID=301880 RepID=A0ABQ5B4M5_9ASTR